MFLSGGVQSGQLLGVRAGVRPPGRPERSGAGGRSPRELLQEGGSSAVLGPGVSALQAAGTSRHQAREHPRLRRRPEHHQTVRLRGDEKGR